MSYFQDTVIALQALGEYAAATKRQTTNLQVKVLTPGKNIPIDSFEITSEDTNREFVVPLVSMMLCTLTFPCMIFQSSMVFVNSVQ